MKVLQQNKHSCSVYRVRTVHHVSPRSATVTNRCSRVKREQPLIRTELGPRGASDTTSADLLTLQLELRRQRTNEKTAPCYHWRRVAERPEECRLIIDPLREANHSCRRHNQSSTCKHPSKTKACCHGYNDN